MVVLITTPLILKTPCARTKQLEKPITGQFIKVNNPLHFKFQGQRESKRWELGKQLVQHSHLVVESKIATEKSM